MESLLDVVVDKFTGSSSRKLKNLFWFFGSLDDGCGDASFVIGAWGSLKNLLLVISCELFLIFSILGVIEINGSSGAEFCSFLISTSNCLTVKRSLIIRFNQYLCFSLDSIDNKLRAWRSDILPFN